MNSPETVRIDKWLWAVRLYKSRTLAAAACAGGHVRIGGQAVKSSRTLRMGEIISAATGEITRTVRVLGLIDRRVGASLVANFFEDLTPAAEYSKQRERKLSPTGFRPKGAGRPTKKDRRRIESFFG